MKIYYSTGMIGEGSINYVIDPIYSLLVLVSFRKYLERNKGLSCYYCCIVQQFSTVMEGT